MPSCLDFRRCRWIACGGLLLACSGLGGLDDDDDTDSDLSGGGNEIPAGAMQPSDDCVPDYDCEPDPPSSGDFHEDCAARVNQFRLCVCLPPIARNRDGEGCADQQAEYDSDPSRDPHSGFSDGICEPSGSAQNECPGWGSTEQVVDGCIASMFGEGPPPNENCEGQCYQEHGHYINMTGDYSSVSCGIYEGGGETWSVQNFHR